MDFEKKIGTTFLDYDTLPTYNRYHQNSHEKVLLNLLPLSKKGNIVDLGCAGGTYYDIMKRKGYEKIFGIDLSNERLTKAKEKGYIVYNTYAQTLPFENNSIDGMICIDMFVHVLKRTEREAIFRSVYDALKPKGFFIFSIASQKAYIYGNYGLAKETIYSDPDGIINDYCALMNFKEVSEYINKIGFKTINITGTQFDFKFLKSLKRITKEHNHYKYTLPILDNIFGRTFFKEFGKAAFFKIEKS